MIIIYIPYTYRIFHKQTQKYYFGSKTSNNKKNIANPINFWKTYFTSSKEVHKLIEQYGKDSFEFKITKIFTNGIDARNWEAKFLTRINAASRSNWINQTNGDGKFHTLGIKLSEYQKQQISIRTSGVNNYMFGKTHNKDICKIISIARTNSKGKLLHSEKTKEKIKNSNLGKKRTLDTKIKISLSRKNRIWITNGSIIKSIHNNDLDKFILEGFKKGRKFIVDV